MRLASECAGPVLLEDYKEDAELPPEETIDMINGQLFSAFMAVTSEEPFDITLGSGQGQGLEAWRRLHRRYDPMNAQRSHSLLRQIMAPERTTLQNLRHEVERL